jgi:predicted nucleotidyltransferase
MVETGTHAEELARHVVGTLKNGLSARLVALVLFGSRARGEGSGTSDWDLLVIAEGLPAKTFDRNLFLKQLIPLEWRGRVSILAKTPEQFHGAVSSLYLDAHAAFPWYDLDILLDIQRIPPWAIHRKNERSTTTGSVSTSVGWPGSRFSGSTPTVN